MKTQGANKDVVFLSGVRTGFGAFGGSLKELSAIDLGAAASRHAIQRSGAEHVATDCPLAALRIEEALGRKAVHPIVLLRHAYGIAAE